MITKSERRWAKAVGLQRTDLRTLCRGKERIVYRDKNGSLYYVDKCHYYGTFYEHCYTVEP